MDNRKENERKFWDKAANNYDNSSHFDKAYKLSIENCKNVLTGSETVLDIACGTGILTFGIAENVSHITGLDLSEEMIKMAIRKTPNNLKDKVTFKVGDGYSTDFSSESFDTILIFNALHIVKEPDALLRESYRILKNGGHLITATDCYNEPAPFGKRMYHFLPKMIQKIGVIKYLNCYTRKDIDNLFVQNNFHIINTEILFDKPTNYFIMAEK